MTLDQQHRTPYLEGTSLTGPVASAISNAVVRLVREHFGKGPTQAKTLLHDDVVVTVLRGGFTHAEKTLYKAGHADVVEEGRRAMQSVFEREMRSAVERLTGRHVAAFLSANHHEPDASVEIFLLEPAGDERATDDDGDRHEAVAVDENL
jgi:uncharacterized protein YbcI